MARFNGSFLHKRIPMPLTTKGASLLEVGIALALVAVVSISATIKMGEAAYLGYCESTDQLRKSSGKERDPSCWDKIGATFLKPTYFPSEMRFASDVSGDTTLFMAPLAGISNGNYSFRIETPVAINRQFCRIFHGDPALQCDATKTGPITGWTMRPDQWSQYGLILELPAVDPGQPDWEMDVNLVFESAITSEIITRRVKIIRENDPA